MESSLESYQRGIKEIYKNSIRIEQILAVTLSNILLVTDVNAIGQYVATPVFCFPGLRIGSMIADVHDGGISPRALDIIVELEKMFQGVFIQTLEECRTDPILTR